MRVPRTPNPCFYFTESRTPNPEPRTPNSESRIPNPESRIPNPEPLTLRMITNSLLVLKRCRSASCSTSSSRLSALASWLLGVLACCIQTGQLFAMTLRCLFDGLTTHRRVMALQGYMKQSGLGHVSPMTLRRFVNAQT